MKSLIHFTLVIGCVALLQACGARNMNTPVGDYRSRTYPLPVPTDIYSRDSTQAVAFIDSCMELQNDRYPDWQITSIAVDTLIYSQRGDKLFVIYSKKFGPNQFGNDIDPGYLSGTDKSSIGWELKNGSPNRTEMSGNYHELSAFRAEVRKFYFERYLFPDADSLQQNFFWK